jgi:hypothetical protein
MIFDINEENIDLLAIAACPIDMDSALSEDECTLLNDEVFYGLYNGSCIAVCRACWLKWLFKGSEGV